MLQIGSEENLIIMRNPRPRTPFDACISFIIRDIRPRRPPGQALAKEFARKMFAQLVRQVISLTEEAPQKER